MSFFKRINTKIMLPFLNKNIMRFSHRHTLQNIPKTNYPMNNIIINLLGEINFVDEASWEIKTFAQEKKLYTANVIYNSEMISCLLSKDNYLDFIINRCYTISCNKVMELNKYTKYTNYLINWKTYNLYVMPPAKNRFNTDNFVKKCCLPDLIIYPLEASGENKRRYINCLIDSKDN